MREALKHSLLIESPVLILGIGLVAPLLANGTLHANLFLGLAATGTLAVSNVLIAAVCPRVPKNVRIGAAILIGGIVLTIAKIASGALPVAARISPETLVPILLVTAIMTADAGTFAAKNAIRRALFDGCGIGLGFTALLVLLELSRDYAMRLIAPGGANDGVQVFGFFGTLPGIFVIVAIIALAAGIVSKKKKSDDV